MKQKSIFAFFAVFTLLYTPLSGLSSKAVSNQKKADPFTRTYIEIDKKASPSVVYIEAEMNYPHTSFENGQEFGEQFPFFPEEFFHKFFNIPRNRSQRISPFTPKAEPTHDIARGSGFIITKDGYIATNAHVVKGAGKIMVRLLNGKEYEAKTIGTDWRTDIAVIKIEKDGLPFLEFADSSELEKGERIAAIGNPFGLESTITSGIISALGRQGLGLVPIEDYIQIDAAIDFGSSGGPLLNLDGNVIGITSVKKASHGFAISSNLAKHVIDQIISTGVIKRAYMGVILQEIDSDLAKALDLSQKNGVLLADVRKNSPAAKAGLKEGDIILGLNQAPVENMGKLRNTIALAKPGSTIDLKILRGNKEMNISVDLGTLTESEVSSQELSDRLGFEIGSLENLSPNIKKRLGSLSEQEGVIITSVKPRSSAASAGLRPGYLITGIMVGSNQMKKTPDEESFNEALHEIGNQQYIVLIVRHQNYQKYYTIKMPH